jgi:L-aminopeptidase/D-esterase-like protein
MQKVQLGADAGLVGSGAGAVIFFVWTAFEKQIKGPFGSAFVILGNRAAAKIQ